VPIVFTTNTNTVTPLTPIIQTETKSSENIQEPINTTLTTSEFTNILKKEKAQLKFEIFFYPQLC